MNRPIRLLVGACVLLAFVAPVLAQSVYTWKDDKGITHYSDSPPPKGAKKRDVRTQADPVPSAKPAAAATRANAQAVKVDPEAQAAAAEARAKARASNCKMAQANVAVLGGQSNVGVDKDGDGKADAIMDAKQRDQERRNMQAVADANCN